MENNFFICLYHKKLVRNHFRKWDFFFLRIITFSYNNTSSQSGIILQVVLKNIIKLLKTI